MNIVQTNRNEIVGPDLKVGSEAVIKTDNNIVSQIASLEIKKIDVGETSQPSKEAIAKAANDIQNFVKDMGRNLNFSVDEVTGYNVVRVINPETNELVRQLPSEELLKIARNMQDLGSVLVSQKA
ncbi:MAG: flagellar protein FlaG [Polynucleobacter sp.]|jgi:flagellar protein FlaG|nr:flagellar protein FlaG [Polynucleobacter sp.]